MWTLYTTSNSEAFPTFLVGREKAFVAMLTVYVGAVHGTRSSVRLR